MAASRSFDGTSFVRMIFIETIFLFSVLLISSVSASSSAPWQDTTTNIVDMVSYEDIHPSIFAPNGRLYSIQSAIKSIEDNNNGNTVIAIQCQTGVVVVTTLPTSPYITQFELLQQSSAILWNDDDDDDDDTIDNDSDNHISLLLDIEENNNNNNRRSLSSSVTAVTAWPPFTRLFVNNDNNNLSPPMLAITAGNVTHSYILRNILQKTAEQYRYDNNEQSSPSSYTIAHTVADYIQERTQTLKSGIVLAATAIIFTSNTIWRIDPTGQFMKCLIAIAGYQSTYIHNILLQKIINKSKTNNNNNNEKVISLSTIIQQYISELSVEDAIQIALDCILEMKTVKETNKHKQLPRIRAIFLSNTDSSTIISYSPKEITAMISKVS